MVIAYVLINCQLGTEVQIINELTKIPEIKEVTGTYGVYDIFCKIDEPSQKTVEDIIVNNIRKIPHITHTNTIHVIPEQGGK